MVRKLSNRKKLMLIYPNQRWQKDDINTVWDLNPSTLCLLSTMVKDIVDVKIVDAQFHNMTQEAFRKVIENYNPDYVSVSVMTSEYCDILDIAAGIVKSINKNIIVIAGGVHVTTNYDYVMKNKNIDYAVRGEGEYVLKNLIEFLNGGTDFPSEGLIFRNGDEIIVQNQAIVKDISKLPWPAYELIDYKMYLNKAQRFGPNRPAELPCARIVTTRGCPFGCSFCQVEIISGKKVRARNPEDVVDELIFLKEKYGIKSIVFEDDNLLMAGNNYAKRLFTLMIEKKLELKWTAIAFALFLLTDELLDLMRDSGCTGINVAIESGNKRVLKEIVKKPIKDLNLVPEIIEKIKARGMYCIANFVIGFPGETWDEIRETINFAEHCGADYIKIFVAVVLHKTKLHKIAMETGALVCDDEHLKVDWRFSQIKSEDWTAKDVSILRAYEWDRINFSKNRIHRTAEIWGMTIDELKDVRKKTRDNLVF